MIIRKNEHPQRLIIIFRQKAHSIHVDNGDNTTHKKENQSLKQLRSYVEVLTDMVATLKGLQATATQAEHLKTFPLQISNQTTESLCANTPGQPPHPPAPPRKFIGQNAQTDH